MSCSTSGTSHTARTSVDKDSATTFAVADPRVYPGCRDTSDEIDAFGLLITGGVYFELPVPAH